MSAVVDRVNSALALLQIEECDAWFEYLESCRRAGEQIRYEELEPWAWTRLQTRLKAIAARRKVAA